MFLSCFSFPSSPSNSNSKKIGSHKVRSFIEARHHVESGTKMIVVALVLDCALLVLQDDRHIYMRTPFIAPNRLCYFPSSRRLQTIVVII